MHVFLMHVSGNALDTTPPPRTVRVRFRFRFLHFLHSFAVSWLKRARCNSCGQRIGANADCENCRVFEYERQAFTP